MREHIHRSYREFADTKNILYIIILNYILY